MRIRFDHQGEAEGSPDRHRQRQGNDIVGLLPAPEVEQKAQAAEDSPHDKQTGEPAEQPGAHQNSQDHQGLDLHLNVDNLPAQGLLGRQLIQKSYYVITLALAVAIWAAFRFALGVDF